MNIEYQITADIHTKFIYCHAFQMDCNPSRKQLEHIASTVNLKKRVVQVWFQNTRARERKGHYRAHQQLINKRCPFCRALFRAKSALESHLATKHPEEMAKGDINVDLIPDAVIEPAGASHGVNNGGGFSKHGGYHSHSPAQPSAGSSSSHKLAPLGNPGNHGHKSSASSHTSTSAAGSAQLSHELSKFLPPGIPNYMAFMAGAGGLGLPFPPGPPAPEMLGQPPFEDPFFKKYMSELANSMAARHEQSQATISHHRGDPGPSPSPRSHSPHRREVGHPSTVHAHGRNPSPKPSHHQPPPSRPVDAHKAKSSPLPPSILPSQPSPQVSGEALNMSSTSADEAPLDLSKPAKPASSFAEQPTRNKQREAFTPRPAHHNVPSAQGISQSSLEMEYLRRLGGMDDSFSETQSEAADPEFMTDIGGSPASPSPSSSGRHAVLSGGAAGGGSTTPNTTGKRYRTQMSATQVGKVV